MNFADATRIEGPPEGPFTGRVLGIVPARLASTRLPRKPLHPLLGRPLIAWVWRRVAAMTTLDRVVVATEHPGVVAACRAIGAEVHMTRSDHPSGTDRVAEIAARPEFADFDIVVNIQGDEPLIREEHVAAAVGLVRRGWPIGTCASPLQSAAARVDPSVVKVARAASGRALYFSRAPIPHMRDGEPTPSALGASPFLRHLGIYAYRRSALVDWVARPPSVLEELEKLEQLRPLEAGTGIGVAIVGPSEGGVDTPADAVRTELRLKELGFEPSTEPTGAP